MVEVFVWKILMITSIKWVQTVHFYSLIGLFIWNYEYLRWQNHNQFSVLIVDERGCEWKVIGNEYIIIDTACYFTSYPHPVLSRVGRQGVTWLRYLWICKIPFKIWILTAPTNLPSHKCHLSTKPRQYNSQAQQTQRRTEFWVLIHQHPTMKKISQLAQSIIRPIVGFLKGNKSSTKNASRDRSVVVRK